MEGNEIIQWHPAFCSAVKLELRKNKQDLSFDEERYLSKKPIHLDLLVVKKEKEAVIENRIGRFFRGHNTMEYKSPDQQMNVDAYYKTLAYACMYKASADHEDEIKANDITISLVRENYPRELLKWFINNDYQVKTEIRGIYYVCKAGLFDTQIIVISQLEPQSHSWLTYLTKDLQDEDIWRLASDVLELTEKDDRLNADSVLNVVANLNKKRLARLKESADMMGEAMRSIFAPELEEATQKGINQGKKEYLLMVLGRKEPVPEVLSYRIMDEQSEEQLEKWFMIALDSSDVQEFCAQTGLGELA